MMKDNDSVDIAALTQLLLDLSNERGNKRFLLGLTGVPGSGKSTLATSLMNNINKQLQKEVAVVVPMDGFHYHNELLVRKGLLQKKGSWETFDSENFVKLVKKIVRETTTTIYCPAYDRKLHNPVENAIEIQPIHKIIIVEGNYLLLDKWPWSELPTLFDESWFIAVPLGIVEKRLINRHVVTGRSLEEALQKVTTTDLPNAQLIMDTKERADKIIRSILLS